MQAKIHLKWTILTNKKRLAPVPSGLVETQAIGYFVKNQDTPKPFLPHSAPVTSQHTCSNAAVHHDTQCGLKRDLGSLNSLIN